MKRQYPTVKMDAGKSIANWSQAVTGYPCSIAFAGQKHICADKESLELAIADLLADLFVAKTLFKPGVDLVVAANVIY